MPLNFSPQLAATDDFSLGAGPSMTPSLGSQMGEPLPGMVGAVPTTPEEVAARRSSWAMLADKIKNDPNLQMTLMKFGTAAMQPVPAGQSGLGHFGGALQGSVDYLQALKDTQARRAFLEAQTGKVTAETTTERERPAGVRAGTRKTTAEAVETEATTPGKVLELRTKIDKLRLSGQLDDAQAAYYRARAAGYPQEVAAELKRAEAAETAAKRNPVLETLRVQAKAMVEAGDYATEAEAMAALGAGRVTGRVSGQVQNRADIEKRLKTINPQNEGEADTAYKARVNKLVLEEEKKAKTRPFYEAYQKWSETNRLNYPDEASAYNDYVKLRRRMGDLPEGIEEASIFSAQQVREFAKKSGRTYDDIVREIRAKGGEVRGR